MPKGVSLCSLLSSRNKSEVLMNIFLCAAFMASLPGIIALYTIPAHARNEYNDYLPKWYVGLRGSINAMEGSDLGTTPLPDTDYEPGFGAGGSIGIMMPRAYFQPLGGLRIEAEYGRYWQHINNNRPALIPPVVILSSGERDFDVQSYMLNAYYHFPLNAPVRPYIGAGFGKAEIELADDPLATAPGDNKDTTNAWQFMAGLTFAENADAITEWRLGYRYFQADKPEFDDGFGGRTIIDPTIHTIEAGMNFRF
jgi:opacity protein-like surface antigen